MIIRFKDGRLIRENSGQEEVHLTIEAKEHFKSVFRNILVEEISKARVSTVFEDEKDLIDHDSLDEDITLFINEKYNLNKDDFTRNEPEEEDEECEHLGNCTFGCECDNVRNKGFLKRTEEMMLENTFDGYTEEMTVESESALDVKKKKSKSKLEFYFLSTIFTLFFPVFLALVLFSSAVELYFDAVGKLYNKYKE
ncbi:hypothetical protein [Burkholderia cepacia]|uniref:hypothetical protein n=1 Tax=Burkholderia cepacia TaxID=292 RepID=UPI00158A1C67|nr:hypothetical protein [Burkholderia cepacia]